MKSEYELQELINELLHNDFVSPTTKRNLKNLIARKLEDTPIMWVCLNIKETAERKKSGYYGPFSL